MVCVSAADAGWLFSNLSVVKSECDDVAQVNFCLCFSASRSD
jgi:hypothetical protein